MLRPRALVLLLGRTGSDLIDEVGVDVLGPTYLRQFKQIQDFAHHIDEMLAQLSDVFQARD